MVKINAIIKNAYQNWKNKDYIFEKQNNEFKAIKYGDFIEKVNALAYELIDKGLKKTEFAKEAGISPGTLAKLSKNETISMENLLKIYKFLGCNSFDEIIEIID